jgi:hypothetical protein
MNILNKNIDNVIKNYKNLIQLLNEQSSKENLMLNSLLIKENLMNHD